MGKTKNLISTILCQYRLLGRSRWRWKSTRTGDHYPMRRIHYDVFIFEIQIFKEMRYLGGHFSLRS
ncbi:hypothetical protein I7I53_07567 [Histoplasma capsulatum var. duboisii H88]|uniref:Uncharacterized protein n=1 Tax=Ajellomyces capsulatus (strain H88) TaxID=544711 RepID=A0A8A1LGK1_AJEC8|nr:hypothetical protein I7I53_07567 [Histoplasma capsulatum var. duboisii H88]